MWAFRGTGDQGGHLPGFPQLAHEPSLLIPALLFLSYGVKLSLQVLGVSTRRAGLREQSGRKVMATLTPTTHHAPLQMSWNSGI
jgi:hypothetical protein